MTIFQRILIHLTRLIARFFQKRPAFAYVRRRTVTQDRSDRSPN